MVYGVGGELDPHMLPEVYPIVTHYGKRETAFYSGVIWLPSP